MPIAMRVTFTPNGFNNRERYTAVASPSTVGLVATINSFASPDLNPLQKIRDAKLIRPDAAKRRKRAVQHVVQAAELARGFDGQNIVRLLHHADHRAVAVRVAAEVAQLAVADVVCLVSYCAK